MASTTTTEVTPRTTVRALATIGWLWPALLFLSVGLFNFVTLMRSPAPFWDEAWNACRSWGLLATGKAFGTLDAGVIDAYPNYWNYFPWIGTAIHSAFMWLFGPQLLSLRLSSLVFGLVLLFIVYAIGGRLYNRRVGLIAALVLSLSTSYLYSSHLGRHDIVVAAMGFGAVALFVYSSRQGFTPQDFLAGLLVGLTVDVHLNGLIYIPAFMGLYLVDCGWAILKKARFWAFVFGLSAGLLFFLAIHVLPNPHTFFTIYNSANSWRTPPVLATDKWLSSLIWLVQAVFLNWQVLIAVMAFVLLLARRSHSDIRLVVLSGLLMTTFAALIVSKMLFYLILISPAACLMVAALLDRLFSDKWMNSRLIYIRTIGASALVVASCSLSLLPALQSNADGDFQFTMDRIAQATAGHTRLLGTQTYWFAEPGTQYFSWEQVVYYRRSNPGSDLAAALAKFHPDVLILDQYTYDLSVADDSVAESLGRLVPAKELQAYLDGHTRLISTFHTETFGTINIYKVDWSGTTGQVKPQQVRDCSD